MKRHRRADPVPGPLLLLAAILDDHTATPGGTCVGRAPWWDPEVPGETYGQQVTRLGAAARACQRCPVRPSCPAPVRY